MYDWPEERACTDALWARYADALRAAGLDAPAALSRCNADLPPVPGGIRDARGAVVAPDPAACPPRALDVDVLWRHPRLLLAQTCWGPLDTGLAAHVHVLAQPDYSAYEGGSGIFYRSALVMRGGAADAAPPAGDAADLPVERLRGLRLACNRPDSMSGRIALERDLRAAGALHGDFDAFWSAVVATGTHRGSVIAVAQGRADVAAVDCRSLDLCRRHEPDTARVRVVGWTAARKGLPLVTARALAEDRVRVMKAALAACDGLHVVA